METKTIVIFVLVAFVAYVIGAKYPALAAKLPF